MQLMRVVGVLFLLGWAKCLAVDFCNMTECRGLRHLGCNNDLTFHMSCMGTHELLNMQIFRDYLVKIHNKYREDVAAGSIMGLSKASHMPELLWHSKLALMAEYHVKRCLQNHNYCMAVPTISNPALNYGLSWLDIRSLPSYTRSVNSEKLTNQVEQWMHQMYTLANGEIQGNDVKEITNILNDHNQYMGCAAAEDYNRIASRFVLICYFDQQHKSDSPIYSKGTFMATNCHNGPSPNYAHLCETLPDIND